MKKHYRETLIYKQWISIKKKHKCIILFQMGDFYDSTSHDAHSLSDLRPQEGAPHIWQPLLQKIPHLY